MKDYQTHNSGLTSSIPAHFLRPINGTIQGRERVQAFLSLTLGPQTTKLSQLYLLKIPTH